MEYTTYSVRKRKWEITDKYVCASLNVMSLCPNDFHDSGERRYHTVLSIYSVARMKEDVHVSLYYSNDRYVIEVDGERIHEGVCPEYVRPPLLPITIPEEEQSKLKYLHDLWWREREMRRDIFITGVAVLHDLIWKEIPPNQDHIPNDATTGEELRSSSKISPTQPTLSPQSTLRASQDEIYQSGN